MLAHQMFQSITAEPFSSDRGEQWFFSVAAFADPGLDQFGRVTTKRRAAFFATLADAPDMSSSPENDVVATQVDQLGRS
jgi:hypothetical protein